MTSIPETTRELDSRVSDGIEVRLLWAEHDGGLTVAVTDSRTGEAFCVAVRDGENPTDVFHHPFAYAASHGVKTGAMPRLVEDGESELEPAV
jgi:hypothetical protein